jgi:hypothetical protein
MTDPSVPDLILQTLGMFALVAVIAFLTAVVIRAVVAALALGDRSARLPAATPAPAAAASTPGVPPQHLAAIAAAVSMAIGAHRIVRIEDMGVGGAWTAGGKHILRTSHFIRRKPAGGGHTPRG